MSVRLFSVNNNVCNDNLAQENGEAVETMSTKDVYMFPILASSMLFGIYLIVKVRSYFLAPLRVFN